ncbi:unnamed protein product [Prorocentrum cordatum]|uniref:Ion transport domain-containing protein n=1 Tax=Prorocentrum cordatum TaxID=2364126 RepID=A0ABN9RNS5_9DINO|nr:unnamed protein product [Polarella glacialis]
MQWPLRLFWTLDIFFTLFTGYQLPNGTEEFFLRKIWVRYASSWLVPDALIVSLDWAEWILAGRAGLLSGWRLLRMIRFLRLLRLRKFLSLVVQRAKSQKAALLFGIAQSLAAILCLAHGMACIWVGIGRRDDQGWVAHVTRESAGDGVEATRTNGQTYLLALHWALTNFAGTMEVQPQTFWERFYAIFALAFGFLVASAFVSSITSNLTRLSMLSGRRAGEFKDLNTYLKGAPHLAEPEEPGPGERSARDRGAGGALA